MTKFLAQSEVDGEAERIVCRYRDADPDGSRTAATIRHTFDQIYDGRHTGRYRLDQLSKTEKTHIGSLLEVNLRREFDDLFDDGKILDFAVDGIEIDCKYSIRFGGWMIPPEAWNKLLLVVTANDSTSEWGIGVIRATAERMRASNNRDAKRSLSATSLSEVNWIHHGMDLPENVLLHVDREVADRILGHKSGQQRTNELLRSVTLRKIPRGTIETVAQQDDSMKRTRVNGGATTALAPEGLLVVGGTYEAHRNVARDLGAPVPFGAEVVSIPVVPAAPGDLDTVELDGMTWRIAYEHEPRTTPAPSLPSTKKTN